VAGQAMMDPDEWLRQLRAHYAVVRAVVENGDLDARVPACPDWDVRGLVHHLGEIHRWVVVAIREGHPNAPTPVGPTGRTDLLDWSDEGFGALVDLLAATSPQTPCWNFGPRPRTARFWFRRQAHEHAVHGWDALRAQLPSGTDPSGFLDGHIDPALAEDGIDEVVGMFLPRQIRLGRIAALAGAVHLLPTDGAADSSWILAGQVPPEARPAPAASVTGPGEALYLLLWGRVTLDDPRLAVTGDPTIAESVLRAGIVP
jgi:uncharacterized protein (TIGR03083 family)